MPISRKIAAGLSCGAALCLGLPHAASASPIQILYSFTGGTDGAFPFSTLTPDNAGNLYGTTQSAGSQPYPGGYGTIFKLDPTGALTTLHAFAGGAQGEYPESGVSLINGLLYGNAPGGPSGATSVIFSLGTDGSNYTILHAMDEAQGKLLVGLLQPAPGGGIFGLGEYGGKYGSGTLFYLGANDAFNVVHQFSGGSDGKTPSYLVKDSAGNIYGSTVEGGGCTALKNGCGVIVKYAPATRAYTILYSFTGGQDGSGPLLGAVAPDGTLYGAAAKGGADDRGTLFALTPSGSMYSFSVLTPITSIYPGDFAQNPPALSATGALVGETAYRGDYIYRNGKLTIYYDKAAISYGQFLLPADRPNSFYATSYGGGTGTGCDISCGFIFSGTL